MGLGYHQYRKQLWKVRVLLAFVLVVSMLVGWSAITRWQVEREMAARRAAVEAEYAALLERYQNLKADVTYLADERSLEAEVRKHFDVAREGESVVIILDDETGTVAGAATTAAVEVTTPPWWQFWRVW
jgi:cell division protein FtsB